MELLDVMADLLQRHAVLMVNMHTQVLLCGYMTVQCRELSALQVQCPDISVPKSKVENGPN
jgi:hypothetical protein